MIGSMIDFTRAGEVMVKGTSCPGATALREHQQSSYGPSLSNPYLRNASISLQIASDSGNEQPKHREETCEGKLGKGSIAI